MNTLYCVKTPTGNLIGASADLTKISSIMTAAQMDDDLYDIVWGRGCTRDDSIRKRFRRAGYKAVPVKVVEIKE